MIPDMRIKGQGIQKNDKVKSRSEQNAGTQRIVVLN